MTTDHVETDGDATTELQALRSAMAEQQRRIEQLEARLGTGAPAVPRMPRTPAPEHDAADVEKRSTGIDRRALFGLAGAGIAGAAVLGTASPAAAADGDNIAIGVHTSTSSTNPTEVFYTGAGAITGSNGAFTTVVSNASNPSTAIAGETSGTGNGVSAFNFNSSSGSGLEAQNANPSPTVSAANFSNGPAVYAQTTDGIAGIFTSSTGAAIQLFSRPQLGPPTADFWAKGSFIVDFAGNLFVCTTSGTPGSWTKATGSSGLTYLPTPVRGYDSRPSQPGPGIKAKMAAGETRSVALISAFGGRTSDVAVLANVTVTSTTGAGFLSVYSGASPDLNPPSFSSVNWSATGQTVGNNVQSAIDSSNLKLYASQPTHVIIDIVGYVEGDYDAVG